MTTVEARQQDSGVHTFERIEEQRSVHELRGLEFKLEWDWRLGPQIKTLMRNTHTQTHSHLPRSEEIGVAATCVRNKSARLQCVVLCVGLRVYAVQPMRERMRFDTWTYVRPTATLPRSTREGNTSCRSTAGALRNVGNPSREIYER